MDIYLLDNLNRTKSRVNIIKPKSFQQLLIQINQIFRNISKYYELFIIDTNNKEIKIDNQGKYNIIGNTLFIREVNKDLVEQSLFERNYNQLTESKQEILDNKYNCTICAIIIKNEKPYLCYKCQKIFHDKCLKDWDKACKSHNKKLSCPNCRNELPLEKWNKKLDYEDNRKDDANLMNKINEYKINNNMNNNINKIKDEKIKKYENYINKTIEIFKNILNKMNDINRSLKLGNNIKLNNLLNNYTLNINNINDISNVINEEIDKFYIYIQNANKIMINNNNRFNLLSNVNTTNVQKEINEYRDKINLIYFANEIKTYTIFGYEFVQNNKNNVELIINGKKNQLVCDSELKKGDNIITLLIKNKLKNLRDMFSCCKIMKDKRIEIFIC